MLQRSRLATWASLVFGLTFTACNQGPKELKIDGLYLGMDLAQAYRQVEKIYRRVEGREFREVRWIQLSSFASHTDRNLPDDVTIGNSDHGIRYVVFNPGLVNKMFDTATLGAEELAGQLARRYGLPSLTPVTQTVNYQSERYWEYVSSRGWKLVVRPDKTVILQDWRTEENEKW